jgi:hypothetical protein
MDRITHQPPRQQGYESKPPRQQGYGSTSSLRNDSLKHTRKHERGEESNQSTKQIGSGGPSGQEGGPSGQEGRTVRPGGADCPHGPRGPSDCVPRTVRTGTADSSAWSADWPLKPTEPPEANPEKQTVRTEHADCPLGTRGLSARHTRTVRNLAQPKLEITTDRKRRRARTRRTRDEHCVRGPSARPSRTVRKARTEPNTARPRESTPPIHHRISQTVEADKARVCGHDKRQTRILYPQNFSS